MSFKKAEILDKKKPARELAFFQLKYYLEAAAEAAAAVTEAAAASTVAAAEATEAAAASTVAAAAAVAEAAEAAASTTAGAGAEAGVSAGLLHAVKAIANRETSKSDFFMFVLSKNRSKII